MKTVYLLTGRPGTGQTSLVKKAGAELKGKPAGSIYYQVLADIRSWLEIE